MKIVYIKPGKIFENTGGGIEARKIYYALEDMKRKDPDIDIFYVSSDDFIEKGKGIRVNKNRQKDMAARMLLHSSHLFIDWRFKGLRNTVEGLGADVAILGNSRLGFIAKDIRKKRSGIYIIGHFDNIETDYIDGAFAGKKGMVSGLMKMIERISVYRDEKAFLENIDHSVFLSERDKKRAAERYGGKAPGGSILPICVDNGGDMSFKNKGSRISLVFLGSLWYRSNTEAVTWFLDNVWDTISERHDDIELIIGGMKPPAWLKRYIGRFEKVSLYPDYINMEDIVPADSVFISPIKTGAGMKVKIAKAMAAGMPVIGTEEALSGYDQAIGDELNKGAITRADSADEYIDAIEKAYADVAVFPEVCKASRLLHKKYYSMDNACRILSAVIDEVKKDRGL